jgi:hypothetical protein
MSNRYTIKEKTSFLPATQSKAFKPLNVPDFIKGIFPYVDNERATPSMIKMNKGAALVALGGKGTPQAFITGLMYALSAHAWGQGKAEEMAKALAAYAGEALKHGAAFLPAGKGCDAGMLRSATEEGVFHMLALPAKTRERLVTPTPAIAAPKADNEVGRDYMAQDALLCNPPMDDEQAKRYAGAYLRISQARAETIKNRSRSLCAWYAHRSSTSYRRRSRRARGRCNGRPCNRHCGIYPLGRNAGRAFDQGPKSEACRVTLNRAG